jgi:hypothetical protein
MVQGVGPTIPWQHLQHHGAQPPPPPMNDWVADSNASNHTTPHPGNISPRPSSFTHPSFIIVDNSFVLLVTSIGDSVLLEPFYLNNVLVAKPRPVSFLYDILALTILVLWSLTLLVYL